MSKNNSPIMKKEIKKFSESDAFEIVIGIIKGTFGAIPFVGTAINEAIFDSRSRIKQKRFDKFVNKLSEKLVSIESEKINFNFLQSEEFIDILEVTINKATATKYDEKIDLFANIIGGQIYKGKIEDYDKEILFIELIASLSINELVVLRHLTPIERKYNSLFTFEESEKEKQDREEYQRIHKFNFESVKLDYTKEELFDLLPNETRFVIETLISKSIAYDDSQGRIETKPRTFIGLTPLGKELLEYLIKKNNR